MRIATEEFFFCSCILVVA